jgi:phosphate acetyltransferase
MRVDIMEELRARARTSPQTIVLPESSEETILRAAREILDQGIGRPMLVGAPAELAAAAAGCGVSLEGMEIVDNGDDEVRAALAAECTQLLPEISAKGAERRLRSALNVGAFLVRAGRADAMVAGYLNTTQDVILASMTFIGMKEGITTPSSLLLMRVPGFEGSEGELVVFSDCGVAIAPDAAELADIAITTADTVRALLGWQPRVAMLSFSTRGSGAHESVDRVREALAMVRQREPGLDIDGEFQVDAAVVPAVAARKVTDGSPVAGRANILIFPDLNAGNIAYKCVQRFAKADAFGPFLQGFAKTVSDLSRGSSVADVLGVATMAAVHAQGLKQR